MLCIVGAAELAAVCFVAVQCSSACPEPVQQLEQPCKVARHHLGVQRFVSILCLLTVLHHMYIPVLLRLLQWTYSDSS